MHLSRKTSANQGDLNEWNWTATFGYAIKTYATIHHNMFRQHVIMQNASALYTQWQTADEHKSVNCMLHVRTIQTFRPVHLVTMKQY